MHSSWHKSASNQINAINVCIRFWWIIIPNKQFFLLTFNYCLLIWFVFFVKSLNMVKNVLKCVLSFSNIDNVSSYKDLLEMSCRSTVKMYNYWSFCIDILNQSFLTERFFIWIKNLPLRDKYKLNLEIPKIKPKL